MDTKFHTREAWLNGAVDEVREVMLERTQRDLPGNIRVSVGYAPDTRSRGKTTVCGVLIYPEASADGHYEIFISPVAANDSRLLDVLTHELCHVFEKGHGKPFGALATAMGLEGPMTATTAGTEFHAWSFPVLARLGPCPYAAIDLTAAKKKARTYLKKVSCPDCGWLAQITAKHVHVGMCCPMASVTDVYCEGTLIVAE
jgi:hypothetical protein